jgi:hypothetical protein
MIHHKVELEPKFLTRRLQSRPTDEEHREQIGEALARWVGATVPDAHNPLHQLRTADAVARQVEDLAEHQMRRAALLALADGASLGTVGQELGLSRWAVGKRWPDLVEQAKPFRWFPDNQVEWFKWTSELLTRAPRSAAHEALDNALEPYRSAIHDWWLLLDTPPLVQAVLNTWQPAAGDRVELAVASNLTGLLESYEATHPNGAS